MELASIHEFETSVRDIFVEGDYDLAVVARFLTDLGRSHVIVRTIDCIEIDDSALRTQQRDVGNRERVLYLAEQTEALSIPAGRILCIVDRDFDHWIGSPPAFRDLVLTDYACMDAYAWNCAVLRRFLTVYCNRPNWQPRRFMDALQTPLLSMFAIRLAARSLQMHLTWFDQIKCVVLNDWHVSFDIHDFVSRLLNKNSAMDDFDLLLTRVEYYRTEPMEDARHAIHGHDFSLLAAYLLGKKGVKLVSTDATTIKRAMAICVTVGELLEECLFQRIAEFSGTTN